jgi:eukaryotic-like serine/threonine-protein kinase
MSFKTGTTLGHYKVLEPLGSGGMGEVFKVSDERLGRHVALKILPAHLVTDPDRVRRFVGEARSASALNHPHIITIYEIGEIAPETFSAATDLPSNPIHYIAMEFVSGTTLHSKIHRDHTELKKLLEYFSQAADGLAKAHGAGIVHRDLKPENIMVSDDGYAKILDFGLAKLIEPGEPAGTTTADPGEAATAVMDKTRPGMVMGTIGYMSPEQAQGKPVDQRSDIFSFGCILYEAATHQKPFQGDSLIDSLHKIVYAQAPLIRDINPGAPAELQRIIRKCLAKDPAERYQSIKDVAIDLRDLIKEYDSQPGLSGIYIPKPVDTQMHPPSVTAPHLSQVSVTGSRPMVTAPHEALSSGAVPAITPAVPKRRLWPIYGAALVLIVAIGIALYLLFGPRTGRLTGPAFQNTTITKLTVTGRSLGAVISPDGKYVVHILNEAGKQGLWVRQTATSSNVQVVPADEGSFAGVTFSRDGNYVYFVKGEKGATIRSLYQVPVLGGTPKRMIDDVDSAISFAPDGKRFAFVRHSSGESALIIVNADGSGEQKLLTYKQPDLFMQLAWSPDGKVIAASTRKLGGGYRNEVVAVQVSDGTEKTIGSQKWLGIGGIAWLSDNSALVISAVDQTPGARQLQIWQLSYPDGKQRRITNDLNNYAGVSLAGDSSSLATVQSDRVANLWIAPGGDSRQARQITSGSGRYDQLSFAPDGRLVYLSDASGMADIWVMDADGKNPKQLTSDSGVNVFPSVSADGRYIVFDSNRASNTATFNIWRMGLDGSNPRQLTQGDGEYFPACSMDGKWVVYTPLSSAGKPTLWKIPIDGGDPVQVYDRVSLRPVFSPDGKWIACQSSSDPPNPKPKLAIIPFEGGQPARLLDTPTTQFRWSADGKSILYVDDKDGVSNIWSQAVEGGTPKQLTNFTSDQIFSFDWSRDGKQMASARGIITTDVILIKDQRRAEAKE